MCIYYTFMLHLRAATNPELNKSVESVKEGKSDIKAQFGQYQSELDELIITEKRLKEMYVHLPLAYTYCNTAF